MADDKRNPWASKLIIVGAALLAVGVGGLLVKLLMIFAWHASGTVAVVGLVLLLIGAMLRR